MTNRSFGEWIKESEIITEAAKRLENHVQKDFYDALLYGRQSVVPDGLVKELNVIVPRKNGKTWSKMWLDQLSFDFYTHEKQAVPVCKKIIHSGPCTIVFWDDDTKTVVRCSENDTYDEYSAFCAALAIRIYGTNSHLKKVIEAKTRKEKK